LEPGLERKYGRLVVVGRDSLPGWIKASWDGKLVSNNAAIAGSRAYQNTEASKKNGDFYGF